MPSGESTILLGCPAAARSRRWSSPDRLLTTEGIDLPSVWPGDPRGAMARSFPAHDAGHRGRGRRPTPTSAQLPRAVGRRVDPSAPAMVAAGSGPPTSRTDLQDRPRVPLRVLSPAPRRPRAARPRRCSGSRCSGRCCPTAPRGSRPRRASGCRASSASGVITKPGVQKPHWKPWLSRNACCIGCRSSPSASPSTVSDLVPARLHGEHEARAHGLAVDQHRARAAHAVLAPEVGAGQAEVLAQEVGQRHAHLGGRLAVVRRSRRSVDLVGHARSSCRPSRGRGRAPGAASTCARWRRYSAVPWRSAGGSRSRAASAAAARERCRPMPALPDERGFGRRAPAPAVGHADEARRAPRSTAPSSSSATIAATPTSAKSPWRRATSWNGPAGAERRPPGTRTSTSSSSASSAVVKWPTKKSLGGHDPLAARLRDDQLGVGRDAPTAGSSADGVGVGDAAADGAAVADRHVADERAAPRPAAAPARPTSGDRSAARSRVIAPIASAAVVARDARRAPSTPLMSTAAPAGQAQGQHAAPGSGRRRASSPRRRARPAASSDLVDGRGRVVLERCRLHATVPSRRARGSRDGGRCCSRTSDAERRERVLDRVHDRRGRHDHPALADAAEVDVGVVSDGLDVVDLDVRDVGRRRQQVVHERAGEELAVVAVRGVLEQHRPDPLRHAAADLALDDRRVDGDAAVLDHDVALDLHDARSRRRPRRCSSGCRPTSPPSPPS